MVFTSTGLSNLASKILDDPEIAALIKELELTDVPLARTDKEMTLRYPGDATVDDLMYALYASSYLPVVEPKPSMPLTPAERFLRLYEAIRVKYSLDVNDQSYLMGRVL